MSQTVRSLLPSTPGDCQFMESAISFQVTSSGAKLAIIVAGYNTGGVPGNASVATSQVSVNSALIILSDAAVRLLMNRYRPLVSVPSSESTPIKLSLAELKFTSGSCKLMNVSALEEY